MTAEPMEPSAATTASGAVVARERPAVYDPRRVVSGLMCELVRARVPVEMTSAGRVLEAAERLLRALGVESCGEGGDLAEVLPLEPYRARKAAGR